MIITSQKALRIVANHEILKAVPELLMPVEAYRATQKKWEGKKNCPTCKEPQFFSEVEKQALAAIGALNPDAIGRLKKFLNANELYLNVRLAGQKGEVRRLD